MKYPKYLWYLAKHKWYVAVECFKYGLWWQAIVHDWSKFLPDEFGPYAEFFYGNKQKTEYWDNGGPMSEYVVPYGTYVKERFNFAWLKHQNRNPHHWQYWMILLDDGGQFPLPIPDKFRKEMLADWRGAGRAIHGKDDTRKWYLTNRHNIKLHTETKAWVEKELKIV